MQKSDSSAESELTNGTSTPKNQSTRAGRPAGAASILLGSPSSIPTAVPPLGNPEQSKATALAAKEDGPVDTSRLTCHQCVRQFSAKPLLLFHQVRRRGLSSDPPPSSLCETHSDGRVRPQGRIAMFCGRACCEQFKTQKRVLAVCESCKQEKVLFVTLSFNQQDVHFCSDGESQDVIVCLHFLFFFSLFQK